MRLSWIFVCCTFAALQSCSVDQSNVVTATTLFKHSISTTAHPHTSAVYGDAYLYWDKDDSGAYLKAISLENGEHRWSLPYDLNSWGGTIQVFDQYAVVYEGSSGGAIIDLGGPMIVEVINQFMVPQTCSVYDGRLYVAPSVGGTTVEIVSFALDGSGRRTDVKVTAEADKQVLLSDVVRLRAQDGAPQIITKIITTTDTDGNLDASSVELALFDDSGIMQRLEALTSMEDKYCVNQDLIMHDGRLITHSQGQLMAIDVPSWSRDWQYEGDLTGFVSVIDDDILLLDVDRWARIDDASGEQLWESRVSLARNILEPMDVGEGYLIYTDYYGQVQVLDMKYGETQRLELEGFDQFVAAPKYVSSLGAWVGHGDGQMLGFTLR